MTFDFDELKKSLRESDGAVCRAASEPLLMTRELHKELRRHFTEKEIAHAIRDATGRIGYVISEPIGAQIPERQAEMKDHFFATEELEEGKLKVTVPNIDDLKRDSQIRECIERIEQKCKRLDFPDEIDIDIFETAERLHERGGFEFHAEIKAIDRESRIIEGYANTKNIDRVNDIILPGAFENSVERIKEGDVPILVEHARVPTHPFAVGTAIAGKIKRTGFWIRAKIESGLPDVEDAWQRVERGLLKRFSVGFRTLADEYKQHLGKSIRVVTDLDLFEVSLVTIPANAQSAFSVVKGVTFGSDTFEKRRGVWTPVVSPQRGGLITAREIREAHGAPLIADTKKTGKENERVRYTRTLEYLKGVNENIDKRQLEADAEIALQRVRELNTTKEKAE